MTKTASVGLDVGRSAIVAAISSAEAISFSRPDEIERFGQWLVSLAPIEGLRVAVEASSESSDLLNEPALMALRGCFRVVHPNKVAALRSAYSWSKSDRIDAKVLLELAQKSVGARPESAATASLRRLGRGRHQVIRWRRELRRLMRSSDHLEVMSKSLSALMHMIEDALEQLTELLIEGVRTHVPSAFDALVAIPGLGPTTAAMILSELGDIERFATPRKLVGAAGLHPRSRASGKRSSPGLGAPIRGGGNRHLRRAFLSAVSCMRLHHPDFVAQDQRLRERGKAPMVVRVALARRIAVLVHQTLVHRPKVQS